MSVHKPDVLVFLDKTGADQRNAMKQSMDTTFMENPARNHKPFSLGQCISAIAVLSSQGLLVELLRVQ